MVAEIRITQKWADERIKEILNSQPTLKKLVEVLSIVVLLKVD